MVSMQDMVDTLTKIDPTLSRKVKCNIICAVFGVKQGEARKLVYVHEPKPQQYLRR